MDGCLSLRGFAARLQRLIGLKSKVQSPKRRSLQISAPFNFKHENVTLPGVSEDEIAILKEKAAASRLGVASEDDAGSAFGAPRRAPAPPSALRPVTPSLQVTPSTPLSPAGNLI